ncbi:hypothetical protein L1887_39914 [Cichorium endivia]|nr:hypothetical protein L1887_39914 [Cichorium endivia]
MDLTGSLDPYVEVKLKNYKGVTKHHEKNQYPIWNQVFAFSKERFRRKTQIRNMLMLQQRHQRRNHARRLDGNQANEPFDEFLIISVELKNYIADRRCQLKSTTGTTALNPRKRKPLIQPTSASTTARNFCINHVCLFSFHDSPDVRKLPFFDFSSPTIKSPYNSKSPNNATVFLHIPSRTAAMLLDAAMSI